MAKPDVVAHWHLLVDDFTTDVTEFYASVQANLRERGIDELSSERVAWRERGIFSAKREYLRIRRHKQIYDLCAAPYGSHSFFFSSWGLVEQQGFLASLPIIGQLLRFLFKPSTYYAYDTTLMFQESVGRAVRDAIESARHAKGLRTLGPEAYTPGYKLTQAPASPWTSQS